MAEIAIIADDLTGALDAAAPFARRGARVAAILGPAALETVDRSADVVTVNAGTRAMGERDAAEFSGRIAARLAGLGIRHLFKKIDSTLRGHVAAEVAAVMAASGRQRALVCPAVPSQGRIVEGGHLLIRGDAAKPSSVAAALGEVGAGAAITICDAATPADLRRIVAGLDGSSGATLLVGAAGLAEALAERCFGERSRQRIPLEGPALFVVGSRTEVTSRQLERLDHLAGRLSLIVPEHNELPDGASEGFVADLLAERAAARFKVLRPRTTFLSGGHTAGTVLAVLGVAAMRVLGEVEAGVPVSAAAIDGRFVHVVTKAGGFGDDGFLARLAGGLALRAESPEGCAMPG